MRAARIDPDARRRGLRVSVVEGVAAQAHSALTGLGVNGNAITVGFALLLGARDVSLGLVAAIPPLACAAQLLSANLADRVGSRRPWVLAASTAARLVWLGVAALPLVLGFGDAALGAFLALWTLSCALLNFSGNLWVSWMADLVPAAVRGRYFATRLNVCNAAGIATGLASGYVLDTWYGGVPRGAAASADAALATLHAHGFALLFVVAALFGLACSALLFVQPEPVRAAAPGSAARPPLLSAFGAGFRSPNLRGFLLFVAAFGLTNGCAAPFWQPYQLEELGLSYTFVNGWAVVLQGTAAALGLLVWGRLSARFGHRTVVALTVALIVSHPIYYLVATRERLWPMVLDAASSGLAWSGYNLAVFNLALVLAAGPERERLFAVYATVAGVAQATSSTAVGVLVAQLPHHVELGALGALDRRQVVFLGTMLARVGCLALFLRLVREPGRGPVGAVLAAIPYYIKARMGDAFRIITRERE